MPRHSNRLAAETSPYLLQHAHNPVDWYAWGPEAFERARREDKPIFLSIGYSTCYWCHVMERESFENEAVAAEMNQRFVSIKVDREERPDVDHLYMTAVQVLSRQGGGWPLSAFLTPDLRPFYGGTYYPPTDGYGRPGFVTVLRAIEDAYRNRRQDVEQSASQLVSILQELSEPAGLTEPLTVDENWIRSIIDRSVADYDERFGGFGGAPKFPRPTLLELLLCWNQHHPEEKILQMLRHTLRQMALGGICDQLGGGFHRYSVDAQWLVPHFEIMLYDNAMLAWVYAEFWRQTGEPWSRDVVRGVLDFVLRELTSIDGGFYTALDAEVDGREGASYLWTTEQVRQVLGADSAVIEKAYGLDAGPNFADPHHGSGTPDASVLFLPKPIDELPEEVQQLIEPLKHRLYAARRHRRQPRLDDKVLTSWNALMIRALAHAGQVMHEEFYVAAAVRAADCLLKRHRSADGGLYRSSKAGIPRLVGCLEDYAALTQALLSLAKATGEQRWRLEAESIAAAMRERFEDRVGGGFFFTDREADDLIVRQKMGSDSPLPGPNALAAQVCLELGDRESAQGVLRTFAGQMHISGEAMSAMVQAAYRYLQQYGPLQVPATTRQQQHTLTPGQLAQGVVSAHASWSDERTATVRVDVLSGFHINAHQAAAKMIATEILMRDAEVESIDYPPGSERQFTHTQESLRVYEGRVSIRVRFPQRPTQPAMFIRYQACDNDACLPAVTKPVQWEN